MAPQGVDQIVGIAVIDLPDVSVVGSARELFEFPPELLSRPRGELPASMDSLRGFGEEVRCIENARFMPNQEIGRSTLDRSVQMKGGNVVLDPGERRKYASQRSLGHPKTSAGHKPRSGFVWPVASHRFQDERHQIGILRPAVLEMLGDGIPDEVVRVKQVRLQFLGSQQVAPMRAIEDGAEQ